jgi:hypothetical protein
MKDIKREFQLYVLPPLAIGHELLDEIVDGRGNASWFSGFVCDANREGAGS